MLKLVGTLKPLSGMINRKPIKHIIKTKGIRTSVIVLSMLGQENMPDPKEYIKQICFETTAYLPVYYYIIKSGTALPKIIEMLDGVISRSPTRGKLINRLKTLKTQQLPIPDVNTISANKKREYKQMILERQIDETVDGQNLIYCLQAIRNLQKDEVLFSSEYVRELLRIWFNKHYASAKGQLADNLRRAICWIDEALYWDDCETEIEP